MAVLSRIAENRGIDNPKLHVQIIRNKLFRRIEDHRSSVAATRHHDHFVEPWLEPISKSSEEDNEAGELYKAEEVLSVVLPADEDATLPLYPGEEALDEPAPHVTA